MATYREVLAPFDLSQIGEVPTAGHEQVNQALSVAEQVFMNRSDWLSVDCRISILERFSELLSQNQEEITLEAAREGGKPLKDSRVEVQRAINGVSHAIHTLCTDAGEEIPMRLGPSSEQRLAFTYREPLGVVVAISAFNHPVNLLIHQIIPAIAVGCPVIIKPAEDTPLSCVRLVTLLREAGLPEAFCQELHTSDHAVSEALACDPRVAFFSFIGSAKVGWMLRSKLAPGTRCALEHGGVAPVLITADADMGDALPRLLKAGFYHAGQVCVSVQRIFIERSIASATAEALAEGAKQLLVGDPTSEQIDIGPLIRPAEVNRVDTWVQEAINAGGTLLCGGTKLSETTYSPTVIYDPPANTTLSTQEVFGPVVCVYPYDSLDHAIEQANALPYAFQAAVFTKAIDVAMYAQRRLVASSVMINDHTAFRVDWMPFGGLRQSGLGVGGIQHSMRDMQYEKMLVIRSNGL